MCVHVTASPSSSYLWVQYMAYEVGLTELDRARAVAERALKSTVGTRVGTRVAGWLGGWTGTCMLAAT